MTDQPPIWLMDVDGPLNILQLKLPEGAREFRAGNGFKMMFMPDILKRLASLHEQGRVELQWLTTWESLADVHLAEGFGLPRGLVVAGTSAGDRDPNYWWKLNVVQRLYGGGHRLIWTDDEITAEYYEALPWLKTSTEPDRLIWDEPNDRFGITHEFIDRVEAWL